MGWIVITVLLGIVGWIGIFLYFYAKKRNEQPEAEGRGDRMPTLYGAGIAIGSAALWVIVSGFFMFHTVGQRQVAIVYDFAGTITGRNALHKIGVGDDDRPATNHEHDPRPVFARALRRRDLYAMASMMGHEPPPLGFPSEEEKQDAIRVLEQLPGWLKHHPMEKLLHMEAFAILDEAGR